VGYAAYKEGESITRPPFNSAPPSSQGEITMRTTIATRTTPVGDAVLAASRQVWLASLGAAVVTRDWAQSEAGNVFRTLVKEGTAVESKAIRMVGDGLEVSITRANAVWKQARTTVQSTVKQAAETAVTLVQNNMPKALPKVTLPSMLKSSSTVKTKRAVKKAANRTKRVASARVTKTAKRAKRATKRATRK
jgi:Poly(hydroxyalcanoate) granule associated protein (phasin)